MKWSLFIALLCGLTTSFYLPGTTPVDYVVGQTPVKLKVNKLTSEHNPLPYKFYYLPYCKPAKPTHDVENLGEVLRGDRIFSANNINITAGVEIPCRAVSNCLGGSKSTTLDKKGLETYAKFIKASYRAHMIIDNMEGAVPVPMTDGSTHYEPGYPVGCIGGSTCSSSAARQNRYYLNNHVTMTIQYHTNPEGNSFRIVGFFVQASSADYGDQHWATWAANQEDPSKWDWTPPGCPTKTYPLLEIDPNAAEKKVIFSYSVKWETSEKLWSERWNPYFYTSDADVHWFSITNSFMIAIFLAGMVGMILVRTLNADVAKYNQKKTPEEEESGWKLVHGDVFRPPEHRTTLAMFAGTGAQILILALVTMVFALMGFLSPANRGGLGTAGIALFVVTSAVGGYFSTRLYKQMRGTAWKRVTLYTGMFLPGTVSFLLFILNFFVWSQGSSAAIPFTTMLAVLALWLGIALPLTFCGGYFGENKPVAEPPVGTNVIPRLIPSQVWYMNPWIAALMGGLLPFGAVFIELFFILTAIWANQYYYLFGFLFLVFLILVVTSAEISVVLCYFQLCGEDYRWWWRSFFTSGASAVYLFAYSVFYYQTQLDVFGFIPSLMYFTYSFIMAFVFFLVTGSVGFYACFFFVGRIYARLHLD